MQSIMTSQQLQPVTIQHQRVLTPTGQTIQTLSTAPTTVHTMQQQVQQVPVSNLGCLLARQKMIKDVIKIHNQHTRPNSTLITPDLSSFCPGSGPAASDSEDRLTGSDHTQTRRHTGAVYHAEPHRDHRLDHTHPEHGSASPGKQQASKISSQFSMPERKPANLTLRLLISVPRL